MVDTSVSLESIQTEGIRHNRDRIFTVTLKGKLVYDFLHMLEARAMQERNYLEVRQAVAFAELIREQVKEQGF